MINNWKNIFHWPSVYWNETAASANEKMILTTNVTGIHQLCSFDRITSESHQLTKIAGGKLFGCISSAGKWVIYLDDKDGNEIGHYVRVPFEGGEKEDISPTLPNYSSFFIRTTANDSSYTWVAAIKDRHVVYYLQDNNGQLDEPTSVYESVNYLNTPIISESGRYICFSEEKYKDGVVHYLWHVFDARTQQLFKVNATNYHDLQPVSFMGSDETTVIAIHKNNGYKQTIFIDILSGEAIKFTATHAGGDFSPLFYHERKKQLLLARDYQAKQELYVYDCDNKKLSKNLLSSGTFLSWFNSAQLSDKNEIYLQWENASNPACLARIDISSSSKPVPVYPPKQNYLEAEWEEVYFPSKSGHEVQAWMMRPKQAGNNIPFVISAHGGPHSVSMNSFNPEALMWREAGYGFLAVNYSGSTSFGEEFKSSICGHPGKLEALDMVAARNYLVEEEYAVKNKIILTGWSWGGYITLLSAGLYPDLWAACIAGIPIADTIASYEDESASFKTLDHELFGGSPADVPNAYLSSSPITYVENVQASVLIIHAKNDSRCPARQVQNYADKMKLLGKTLEVHWFNSGHLGHFSDPNIAVENFSVALNFAQNILRKIN